MGVEKGFLGGFLILSFVLFVAGFLTGIIALAVLRATVDVSSMGFMAFVLGFLTGTVTVAMAYMMVKLSRLQKPQSTDT